MLGFSSFFMPTTRWMDRETFMDTLQEWKCMSKIIPENCLSLALHSSVFPQQLFGWYSSLCYQWCMFQVLRSEVSAIRRACASIQQGYEPSVTFLVVQKRHHTRFFPVSKEDEDGRNRNVPTGTVVDSKITHPTELDFFLASHASIQV